MGSASLKEGMDAPLGCSIIRGFHSPRPKLDPILSYVFGVAVSAAENELVIGGMRRPSYLMQHQCLPATRAFGDLRHSEFLRTNFVPVYGNVPKGKNVP